MWKEIMKIIVDEMPRCASECPLSRMECGSDWFCSKYRSECNVDMCDLLKPITDYVFEERIAENITKRIPLVDIKNER
jgi:hypothetical protein